MWVMMEQKYITKYYNLDAILSVGYRVNSKNATLLLKNLLVVQLSQNLRQFKMKAIERLPDKLNIIFRHDIICRISR